MEMPFEEIAFVPPALAGIGGDITPLSDSAAAEGLASASRARRQPILGFFMSLLEAWPQASGPFFTADGQSATCQAQARGDA